jgi:hypothetical protein
MAGAAEACGVTVVTSEGGGGAVPPHAHRTAATNAETDGRAARAAQQKYDFEIIAELYQTNSARPVEVLVGKPAKVAYHAHGYIAPLD